MLIEIYLCDVRAEIYVPLQMNRSLNSVSLLGAHVGAAERPLSASIAVF
jgi:hypothetical protein